LNTTGKENGQINFNPPDFSLPAHRQLVGLPEKSLKRIDFAEYCFLLFYKLFGRIHSRPSFYALLMFSMKKNTAQDEIIFKSLIFYS
jgi:hypothetical protein